MNFLKRFWRAYNSHVLIVAFLIGLFGALLVGLQQTLASAEESVKSALMVVVFLQNGLSAQDADAWVAKARGDDAEILSAEYTSKEAAYQAAMKDPKLAKSLQLLKANPLPASFAVRYSDRAWAERADPAQALSSAGDIQEIRWDPQAQSLYRSLHRWRMWTLRFSAFVGMVLAVWAMIGLYRFLSLNSDFAEIAALLGVGLLGGALAWGLWSLGLRSIQADISAIHPATVWSIPIVIGIVSALGCFGLEVRHAN
jgi:cell division protein FtsX